MTRTAPAGPIMEADGTTRRIIGVLDIAADAREVRRARRWITQRIGEAVTSAPRIAKDVVDNVELCASEIITNAAVHGGGGRPGERITVVLIHAPSLLRVEVTDAGNDTDQVPHVRDIEPDTDVHGRGLEIVKALARRWDHHTDAAGRTVWFEMAC